MCKSKHFFIKISFKSLSILILRLNLMGMKCIGGLSPKQRISYESFKVWRYFGWFGSEH